MTSKPRDTSTSRTVEPNPPQTVRLNNSQTNGIGTVRVEKNSWQIWIIIIIFISIVYELTGSHHASCDWFHTTKQVKHRDVVADLANCQESAGHFGKWK